jgi:RNA polymerase sigma factor for flagellar operon FliA
MIRNRMDATDEANPGSACDVGSTDETATLESLLARYRRRRSVALRNEIVERCCDIVEAMARTLTMRLPPSVDAQDLAHAGMWGLMQAIEKYEPSRCDQFTAFMRIRVRGAMLDELRNMDFLPRLQRRRLRDREAALGRLRMLLSREPSEAELANELGVSVAELQRAFQQQSPAAGRSSAPASGESLGDALELLPDDGQESPIEAINRRDLLAMIRDSLEPIEWKVLQMHYLEGMSGKEVASRLRLSAARICQIHVRVMDRLKARLGTAAV